jgi:hydrogenase nickel incorporation protein HypA/HybF
MHEFSLAQNMTEIIRQKSGGMKVLAVDIEVGAVSGAVPEALSFSAQVLFEEAFGKGVKIRMHNLPAEARCECGNAFIMENPLSPCPDCGGFTRTIILGKDVYVKSIEVDDGE